MRDGAYTGKTTSVVAGGRFEDLIKEEAGIDTREYAAVSPADGHGPGPIWY